MVGLLGGFGFIQQITLEATGDTAPQTTNDLPASALMSANARRRLIGSITACQFQHSLHSYVKDELLYSCARTIVNTVPAHFSLKRLRNRLNASA